MKREIAIVGAGAAAVSLFIRLAELPGISAVRLIDPQPVGLGVAFGTADPALLCNTSVDVTSLDPDGESDLLRYLTARGWPTGPEDFVPRFLVGQYCRERYVEARRRAQASGIAVEHIRGRARAVHVTDAGYLVDLDDGTRITATDLVLCPGLERPHLPEVVRPHLGNPAIIPSPYPADRLTSLPASARVLVIGGKLSAIDAALTLCRGGRTVTLACRSGRLPTVRTRLIRSEGRTGSPETADDDAGLEWFAAQTRLREGPRGGDARTILDHDTGLATDGEVPWQDLVADVIDRINEVSADWAPEDRAALFARHGDVVSRYISSIPLPNARLIQGYLAKDTLTLVPAVPTRLTPRTRGWQVRWPDGNEGHVDHIVCATGFTKPTLRVVGRGRTVRLENDPATAGTAPEITANLRLRLAPDAAEERIWVLGPSAHPRTAIVNYLRTAALHARTIGAQFAAEQKGSTL